MKFIRRIYHKYKSAYRDISFRYKLEAFMKRNSHPNPRNLIIGWDMGGFSRILQKNAIFSKALNLRGYDTHFIICDGVSEACIQRGLEKNEKFEDWGKRCSGCLSDMKAVCKKYSLDYSYASRFIDEETKREFREISEATEILDIIKYKYLGINAGEFAWSSMNRYMKGFLIELKDLKKEDERIYRKYFYAALVNTYIANQGFEQLNPVSLYTSHGVYTDYSPPILLGYKNGIKVTSWASGFAEFLHYFTIPKSSEKLQLRGMKPEVWKVMKDKILSEEERTTIENYFYDRYFKAKARDINIIAQPEDKVSLKKKIGFKNENPIVCLFTHVNWDTCFDLGAMVFENANLWVLESIKKMSTIQNVNWIIRVHPGEITDGSLYTTSELVKKELPILPDHIKVLYHDSDINTYGLYQLIDAGITIFGTVGVELTFLGKPIIATGDAHFCGKGFSIDAKSKQEYFSILDEAHSIKPLTDEQAELAKRYAYSFFIQRQAPLNIQNQKLGHWSDIDLERLDELLPGRDMALDKICEGIINGKDVYLD